MSTAPSALNTYQAGSLLAETAKMAIFQAQNSLSRGIHRLIIANEQTFFSYSFYRFGFDRVAVFRR